MGLFQAAPAPAAKDAKTGKEVVKDEKKDVVKAKSGFKTETSFTPKGTLVIKGLGSGRLGLGGEGQQTGTANFTLKHKIGNLLATVALTNNTLGSVKSLKDLVLTADYKIGKGVTPNAKFDAGSRVTTLGATWDGKVSSKAAQLKFSINSKARIACGEAKLSLDKNTVALVTFNQERVLTAKYTIVNGPWTWEPSYNFEAETPSMAVTRKRGSATYKAAYTLKSEQATLEYALKPFKLTLVSKISPEFKYAGKPTLTALYENVYSF